MRNHRPDLIISCDSEDCEELTTTTECISGDLLETYFDSHGNEVKRLGRYCVRCSMRFGHLPYSEFKRIEGLLVDAGLMKKPRVKKSDRVNASQMEIL